jgi:hypothetical protein
MWPRAVTPSIRRAMAAQVVSKMDWVLAPLAMSPRSQQIFVYGTFLWIQEPRTQAFFAASEPDSALEVFREFGAPELACTLHTEPLIDTKFPGSVRVAR